MGTKSDVEVGLWGGELDALLLRVGERFGRVEPRRRMREALAGAAAASWSSTLSIPRSWWSSSRTRPSTTAATATPFASCGYAKTSPPTSCHFSEPDPGFPAHLIEEASGTGPEQGEDGGRVRAGSVPNGEVVGMQLVELFVPAGLDPHAAATTEQTVGAAAGFRAQAADGGSEQPPRGVPSGMNASYRLSRLR